MAMRACTGALALVLGAFGSSASAGPPPSDSPAATKNVTAKTGASKSPGSASDKPAPGPGAAKPSSPPPGPPSDAARGGVPPAPPTTSTPTEPESNEAPPVDLRHAWTYSKGGGLRPRYTRTNDGVTIETANAEGYYSGVSVEGNHVPPFPAAKMGSKPALLTWTGFERTQGGSRVFFEVSADVATKVTVEGTTITLRILNTHLNVRNNARYLDLRYFRTPVRMVKLRKKGKDLVATITLKRVAVPTLESIDGKAGYKLLVLAFTEETQAAEGQPAPGP